MPSPNRHQNENEYIETLHQSGTFNQFVPQTQQDFKSYEALLQKHSQNEPAHCHCTRTAVWEPLLKSECLPSQNRRLILCIFVAFVAFCANITLLKRMRGTSPHWLKLISGMCFSFTRLLSPAVQIVIQTMAW